MKDKTIEELKDRIILLEKKGQETKAGQIAPNTVIIDGYSVRADSPVLKFVLLCKLGALICFGYAFWVMWKAGWLRGLGL